jgi:hypothetical protein
MKTTWSWLPVVTAVSCIILVTAGPAGTAGAAAGAGSGTSGVVLRAALQTVTDHSVSGNETAVSCLTASLCVAVGSQVGPPKSSHGTVVAVTNGRQSHAAVLRRSSVIYSVSCRKSGCWAIGKLNHGAGRYLVKISTAGRPVAERTITPPAGTTLGPIACSSMTLCEIVGGDNRTRPAAIEIGDWSGRKLSLHRVAVKGSKQVSMNAVSCWHGDCEAVGTATVGPSSSAHGLILTTVSGKRVRLHTDSGYSIGSVSCISATTCYGTSGGGVVTITRGVVTRSQGGAGGGVSAIECTAAGCEVAGGVNLPQYSTSDGFLQSLSDGTWGPPMLDGASYGFSDIAVRGGSSSFMAVGSGATAAGGTDVAVG